MKWLKILNLNILDIIIGIKRNDENTYIYPNFFYKLDGKNLALDESITLTKNYSNSFYQLSNMLEVGSKAYNLLNSNNKYYWLDTKWVNDITNGAHWGFYIFNNEWTFNAPVWTSHGWDSLSNRTYGVRAVVSLKSNVKLVGDGTTGYTLQVN